MVTWKTINKSNQTWMNYGFWLKNLSCGFTRARRTFLLREGLKRLLPVWWDYERMEGAARNLNLRPGKTAWNRKALLGMLPRIRTAATARAEQALRSVMNPGQCSRYTGWLFRRHWNIPLYMLSCLCLPQQSIQKSNKCVIYLPFVWFWFFSLNARGLSAMAH